MADFLTPANDNFWIQIGGRKCRLPDNWHEYDSTAMTTFGTIGKYGGYFDYLDGRGLT
jgi:hypothetical protein